MGRMPSLPTPGLPESSMSIFSATVMRVMMASTRSAMDRLLLQYLQWPRDPNTYHDHHQWWVQL